MASIFLANAPYLMKERYGKLAPLGSTLPHLGLLMLGSVLRKAGHDVRILDASALGIGYRQSLIEAKKSSPDIIALTSVTPSIMKTVRFASQLKEIFPKIPIIIGGPHFNALPEQTLLDYQVFDFGVMGEGEITIVELVEALSENAPVNQIKGLAYKEEGRVIFTGARDPIKDLDSLPFPSWDLLDEFPFSYHPAIFKYKQLPSTHIISARGCPNRCIYCDTSVFSRQIRYHGPEYILDLIAFLVRKFNMREIIFEDDQFIIRKRRVVEICEGLLQKELDISWSCSARVDHVTDLELLRLMKRSGCWQINYGIESGNQEILDFARKGISRDQISRAVRLTDRAGILSKGYFIFGLPFETKKSMEQTIDFAKSLPLNDISVFPLTPFPGSYMYDIADQHGKIHGNYEMMNLLDIVYEPNGLKVDDISYYQRRFMMEFYMSPAVIGNYLKRVACNPSNLLNMLRALKGFLAFSMESGYKTDSAQTDT